MITFGERPVGPGPTTPAARPVRGVLLLVGSCAPVMGAVLITPVLPAMQEHFATTAGAAVLVPLVFALPALLIALLAPFAGALSDRLGRTRLLVGALVAFAVAGTAPAWLPWLPLIVLSRAVLGAAESVIITCCTVLLAEYFTGDRRDHWLGLQIVATSVAATVLFVVGGALAELGWRVPFWLYAVGLLLVPLVSRLPDPDDPSPAAASPAASAEGAFAPATVRLPVVDATAPAPAGALWRRIVLPWSLTLVGAVLFYVVPTQLGAVLGDWGIASSAVIGIMTGGAALATALGGFLAGNLLIRRFWALLPVQFLLLAVGLLMLGTAGRLVAVAAAGAVLAGAGGGLLITALLIWTVRLLDGGRRGLGAGAWIAAFFLGQFLCPLLVLVLTGTTGRTVQETITFFGVAAALMVGVSVLLALSPAARTLAQPADRAATPR